MRFVVLVFTALLSLQTVATQASAAEESAETQVTRLSVALVNGVDSAELRALISEWLDPTGLEVRITGRPTLAVGDVLVVDDDPRRVRVWLELVGPRQVRLYFADPRAERFLVRDVPLEHGLDEVGREQLVQVLLSAAQAFVERRESTPRASVTQSLPPPSVGAAPAAVRSARRRNTVAAKTRFYWSAGARYDLTLEGVGVFAQGVAATFESALERPTTRVGALAEVRYALPHEAESTNLRLTVSALAVRLRFLLALVHSKKRELSFEAGVGLDRVLVEPRERDGSGIRPRASSTHTEPSFGGAIAHFWYLGGVRLGAGLNADVSFYRTYYDVLLNAQRRREIRPWQVQSGIFIGAAWR